MQIEHPSKTLTEAMGAAIHRDLSPIRYQRWTAAMKKEGIDPRDAPYAERRPRYEELEVVMFPEQWSSTALGYGGIGGAAMTPAYTVVVMCRRNQEACIYWGCDRLGLKLDLQEPKDIKDLEYILENRSSHIQARTRRSKTS